MKPFIIIITLVIMNAFAQDLFFIDRGDTIRLSPERSARGGGEGWLSDQYGRRVKIAEGILVELKNEQSAQFVFPKYDIKSFERLSRNIFLVIPSDASKQFELSRMLLDDNFVKNSHPNLIRERTLR